MVLRTVCCAILLLAGCGDRSEPAGSAASKALEALPDSEWVVHGNNDFEQRHSTLDQIDTDSIADLGLAWTYDTGQFRGHEATPIIADGVMYLTSNWSNVHALDAVTGRELWTYDPEVPRIWGRKACCDVVNRGVAVSDGGVFVGTLDGRLIRLNAKTGAMEWEVVTVDQSRFYTITGAPRVVDGKVVIGNGGAEYGVRGYVSAYDPADGDLVWRFWTVPGDPSEPFEHPELAEAARTWTGEWWEVGGGGTVWDSMAYDPDLNLLYVGTGNGSPWSRLVRSPGGGDNLYLASILALDAGTGRLVWHYQTTPGDNWDYTATQHMVLADLEIRGEERQVLMQAPKNGFFYVLDRKTGELLSADAYIPTTWASHVDVETGKPVELESGNYNEEVKVVTPSVAGGHNWHPMSWHPGETLMYIPVRYASGVFEVDHEFEYVPGRTNVGLLEIREHNELWDEIVPTFALTAWDPAAGEPRWQIPHTEALGGLLSTAGNLVFQGTNDGRFSAYTADDGRLLWEFSTGVGIIAPPVTYMIDGEQYLTVVAGSGGAGLKQADSLIEYVNTGRVFTFKLGADLALPEVLKKVRPETPVPDPYLEAAELADGENLYLQYCSWCHGPYAVSGGLIADLRYASPAVHENWNQIVLDGLYAQMGMGAFRDVLNDEQADLIRGYVVEMAQTRDEEAE